MTAKFAFLQLFTYNPQAQPANNTGSQTLSVENKTYYDKQLIRYATPNLVHMQFGQERDIPQKAGQKIEFRSFASLGKALTPLTEGVTPDAQTLSASAIEATVHQYGGFVALTDILDMTAIDPVITETVRLIGDQAGQTLDTIVRDILNTGTNVGYASKISGGVETEITSRYLIDADCKLTVKEVEKQYTELKSQNAPKIDGYYVCIAHPKALYDLKRDPEWRDVQKYTDNVSKIFKNEVGEIGGVRFVETTEAKIFKGANISGNGNGGHTALTVKTAISSATTSLVVSEIVLTSEVGRYILIPTTGGVVRRKITAITASTDTTLTLDENINNVAQGATIYPGEGGANNGAVFSCLFFGANAYGKTKVEGGGLKTIIKPLGSGGTSDPLDQRSTVGWKALATAEILIPQYLRRLEVGGSYVGSTQAN